jgi:hypothetical protein
LEDISKDHFLQAEEWDPCDTSPSLDLLLQVQRLLVSRIFPLDGEGPLLTTGTEKGKTVAKLRWPLHTKLCTAIVYFMGVP